jgi:hypothetical protein
VGGAFKPGLIRATHTQDSFLVLWLTYIRLNGVRAPTWLGHLKNQTTSSDIAHVVTEIATVSASPGADAATATAPERIKIHPAGNLMSRDGRFYIFDVEAFTADGADIPVDLQHGITKNDEPNGLSGRVNWLGAVKDILSARRRRFISPSSLSPNMEGQLVYIPSLSWRGLGTRNADTSPESETEQVPIKSIASPIAWARIRTRRPT